MRTLDRIGMAGGMEMTFSFSYTKAVLGLLLKHPTLLPLFLGDFQKLSRAIAERADAEFKRGHAMKHAKGFDIYLNRDDVSGISSHIAALGYWELAVTELFCKLLKRGMTVIDVGANIGWFTLLSARLVGESGTVMSFEPEATNFSLLSRSVERNAFKQVLLEPKCVSDSDGTLTLFLSSTSGNHSVVRPSDNGIAMPCVKLDTLATSRGLGKIDLLKVDVEGAEPNVLLGAGALLSQSRIERIIVEWNPEAWANHERLLDDLLTNFEPFRVASSSPFLLSPVKNMGDLPPLTNVYMRLRGRRS